MQAEVVLPTGGGRLSGVNRVEVRCSEYMHDTILITAVGVSPARVRANAPISVSIGRVTYAGYVLSKTYKGITLTIRCIGTTSACRNGRQRSWAGKTDSQLVQELAKLNKLTVAVEPTKTKHKMLNQAGKSDWQFMVERAKANGFVIYPRGAQVRFHSRAFELERYGNAAQRLGAEHVISFRPDVSEVVSGGGPKAEVTVSGVDANGQPLAGSKAPEGAGVLRRYNTKAVATSVAAAQEAAAAEALLNAWTYRAHAEVHGNPLLRVGGPVFFGDVEGEYEGFWVIQQAHHVVTPTLYTTKLIVGVDRLGRGYAAPPPASAGQVVVQDELGDASWAPEEIILMDPTDVFDPESDVPAPEDLSHLLLDPELPVEPQELVWAVPPIQPETWYDEAAIADNIIGLQDEVPNDDGFMPSDAYLASIEDEPPAWLLDRVYG